VLLLLVGVVKSFAASSPEVMAKLPEFVRNAFPLVLTKKGAVDKELLELLNADVLSTGNFSAASAKIKELCHEHFYKTQVSTVTLQVISVYGSCLSRGWGASLLVQV
jgi:hypothetical protein